MTTLSDGPARERAATAGDRNIVVTAGAGTGKTTLLVNRLLHLLLHRPEPPAIGDMVALTFTNKAADEMKLRLRTRLSEFPTNALAVKALHELEKSQIGTIHSFAAHLLRLYPIESRVDPGFQQDEGRQFDALFQQEWAQWLDQELGSAGAHDEMWKAALSSMTLEDVQELARGLVGELIPLDESLDLDRISTPIRDWLIRQADLAKDLRKSHLKTNTLERMLDDAAAYLEQIGSDSFFTPLSLVPALQSPLTLPSPPAGEREQKISEERRAMPSPPVGERGQKGSEVRRAMPSSRVGERGQKRSEERRAIPSPPAGERGRVRGAERGWIDCDVPPITKQWARDDYEQAKRIIRVAQAVAKLRLDELQPLVYLILPFARQCRRRFIQSGYISFDGLVARARNLLRDHPHIRRELKQQFRSILVDEFQDTDPVQYEMILYLAEARGSEASDWRSIILEPGKLFIVGDPKQSIYAFRRADMEAYDAVVEDHVLAQTPPGERHTLYTNFRGHAGLISSINGFFARIFPSHAVKGIQPKHEPLLSRDTQASLSCEHVEIRLVRPDGQDADADTAGRAEAEELARWLREQVLEREEIYERGVPVKIKPGHVAILFRTLTDMRDYLEALRRYRIPCLTEGEKHFYERQEVIDAINLLRAAVDPHDRLALAGVLRSSLGAMPDVQIESLTRHQLLDYRIAGTPASLDPHARAAYEAVAPIYTLLRELSTELPYVPLPDVMDTVLAKVPLLELAAASIDGEQAVANVLKLRDLAVQLAKQSAPSLRGLAAELTSHALDVSEEAESTLAEDLNGDGQGFVRLLSIHKAKGLEFPMVILAGLQRGANRIPSRVQVHHDWSTGIVGIKVGDRQTLGGIYVSAKLAERQRAEQSRVLYVAMTRAKRRLILSAGIPKQVAQDSFLAMVAQGFALDLDNLSHHVEAGDMSVESAAIRLDVISGKAVPLDAHTREGEAWRDLDEDVPAVRTRWVERLRRKEELSRWPPFLSPTFMKATEPRDEAARRSKGRGPRSDVAALIGTLAHRILERWDFADDPRKLIDQAADLVDRAQLDTSEIQEIRDTINAILQVFGQSEICRTLCQAMIIGREVPFAIPWCGSATQHSARPGRLTISPACPDVASLIRDAGRPSTQHSVCEKTPPAHHLGGARNRGPTDSPDRAPQHSVMEGVIDLVYRFNGEIWIADYKTDRITEEQIADRADEYRLQAEIYTEAVSRCVGLKPKGFQFIFLRTGTVVPVLS